MVALNTRRQRQEDFCEFETNVGYKQRTLHLTTTPPPKKQQRPTAPLSGSTWPGLREEQSRVQGCPQERVRASGPVDLPTAPRSP